MEKLNQIDGCGVVLRDPNKELYTEIKEELKRGRVAVVSGFEQSLIGEQTWPPKVVNIKKLNEPKPSQ